MLEAISYNKFSLPFQVGLNLVMIPSTICFTGAEILASDLMYEFGNRYVSCPYPANFTRIEIESFSSNLSLVNAWIRDNIFGKWGSYCQSNSQTIILFFEEASDAILFKLLDGAQESIKQLN